MTVMLTMEKLMHKDEMIIQVPMLDYILSIRFKSTRNNLIFLFSLVL